MAQGNDSQKAQQAAENLLKQAQEARREKRYADARRDLQEAANLCQKAGVRFTLAQSLAMSGQIERDEKQLDAALSYYEQALIIFREIGDANKVAHTVRHIADIQMSCGRFALAEAGYDEALKIYRSSTQTNLLDLANAIRGLAILKGEMNNPEAAKRLWEEARTLYETVKAPEGVSECNRRIAELDA